MGQQPLTLATMNAWRIDVDRSLKASECGNHHSGDEEVVVCLGGIFGDAYLVRSNGDSSNDVISSVTRLGTDDEDDVEVVNLSALEYEASDDLAHVKITGESRALQVSALNCATTSLDHTCSSVRISNFIYLSLPHTLLSRYMEMTK